MKGTAGVHAGRQPEVKTTEVEACTALTCGLYSYTVSTAGSTQWCKLKMVVEVTSGKGMHKRLSYAPETQLMI